MFFEKKLDNIFLLSKSVNNLVASRKEGRGYNLTQGEKENSLSKDKKYIE